MESTGFHDHPAYSPQLYFQTLASLLRNCGTSKDLSEGKRLHAQLTKKGLHRSCFLGNILLQMYINCGSLPDVVDCFFSMQQKNRFSWNFLMTAYARHGQEEQSVLVFYRMHCEGALPDEFIYASAISVCAAGTNLLPNGKCLHTQLREAGVQSNVAATNALINMYGKCSCPAHARRLFDQLLDRNVISWTCMISAFLHNGLARDAISLYVQMLHEGFLPNRVTFIGMLDACAMHKQVIEGKRVHAFVVGSGLEAEIVLATGIVNMYRKCGSLEHASELFVCMRERNTIFWTAMLQGFIQHGQGGEALQLYSRMLLEGVLPDSFTYSIVFDGCASQEALTMGKHVHAAMVARGSQSNIVTASSLLHMYGRCGAIAEARCMFDTMEVRNPITWTSMISSCVQAGESKEAMQLFLQMQKEGMSPDKVTFSSVIEACKEESAISEGKWVHGLIMENGLESDPDLAIALINMYGECKELREAQELFNSMQEKNLVSWTSMIAAYAQYGHEEEALLLYDQMLQEGMTPNRVTLICILSASGSGAYLAQGKRAHMSIVNFALGSDVVVMTALVNMYGKCAKQEDARRVFDEMKERNVISWNTMLAVYSHSGCSGEALELFEEMQGQGFGPSKTTCVCVLDACTTEATLGKGKLVHALAVKIGFDLHVEVGNAVVNMYGKCGKLMCAHAIFDNMPERDAISWNIMIGLLAHHGQSKAALNLFEGMLAKGYLPDKITYVAILSACGNGGFVGEGLQHFASLMANSSILPTPEHCHCVIHMFARSGLMEDSESFVEKVPLHPTSVTWMSLLNACRVHLDINRGEYAIKHAIELDDENASSYEMLSSIYAACKSDEEFVADLSCNGEEAYEVVGS